MVQPIQYQIPGALNPFENLVSGLKLGATMADMEAARAQQQAASQLAQQQALAAQAAIARQQQYETGLSKVLTNPNRTYADFEPLFSIAPNKDQLDALKAMGTGADERLKKSQENFTANVLLAIESEPKNPETAKRILNERVEAEKDPQQKQLYQTILKAIEVSPEKAAQVVELGGASMFGENWYKGIVNARKRRAEAALEPSALRTAEASARTGEAAAIKAEIELKTLEAIKAAELRKAQSDADKKAVDAKFAERIAKADLDLKKAQAFASGAAAKSSLASAKKSEFEMTQGPSPLITTIQDPKNPTETITIDVRRYTPGTSIGSAGVIGSSGKSAVYAQKEAKAEEGKTLVADIIDSLKANYQTLNTARAIPSSQRGVISNLLTAVEVSGPGQFASRITGSDVQPVRDVIQSSRLQLLNAIKQATGLSSQQLNSNVELQTWLKSVSDPTQQIEAVIPILENIEKFVGAGGKKIDSSAIKPEGGVDMNNPLLKK